MHGPESAVPLKRTRPRRWWRIFQFSLRTLLILTTLAAVGCWWYLQPKVFVEELAGGSLKLRRQVRERGQNEFVIRSTTPDGLVNIGTWQLRDERGDGLASGRYASDQPHGFWKFYHPNGRKAAEGQMFHGLRVGVWKTWDEEGRRESEVTYAIMRQPAAVPALPLFQPLKNRPLVGNTIPVVGMIGTLGTMPPVAAMLLGGLPGTMGGAPGLVSLRHGPAKAWHASGQLKETGDYRYDRRDGPWKFFDEQGRVVKEGEYRRGLREGTWKVFDPVSREMDTVDFIGDRPRAEHEQLIAQLQAELASGQIERQVAAMDRLEQLGTHGLPHLTIALADSQGEIKLLALRRIDRLSMIPRMAGDSTPSVVDLEAIGRIERLIDSDDERIARLALLIVYRETADRRDALFPRLIESIRQSPDGEWAFQALAMVWTTDVAHRPAVFNELAEAIDRWSRDDYSWYAHPWLLTDWFFVKPSKSSDIDELLCSAMKSERASVRRLAIQWIARLAVWNQEVTKQADGTQLIYFPVPEQFREAVQAARSDADDRVRKIADRIEGAAAGKKAK